MFINNPNYTSDLINKPYIIIQSHLGQSIVVLFLIYSGFGVAKSIKSRGISYIKTFPKKRIFKTWYHFAAAVIIYLLLNIALNGVSKFSISKILLSLTGWESLGNSNWYIFAVLCLYIFTYISFSIFKNKFCKALWFVTALTGIYVIVIFSFKDAWWFDTVICYPIGMWFSFYKEKIEVFCLRSQKIIFLF